MVLYKIYKRYKSYILAVLSNNMSSPKCSGDHRTIASFPNREQYKNQDWIPYICLGCGQTFLIVPFEAKNVENFEAYCKTLVELAKKNIPRYVP